MPTVEGRVPTPEELEMKARSGRLYLEDVWTIVREFPSAATYECRADLEGLVNALFPQVRDFGLKLVDSSDRLNGIHHALELTMAWATLVREARTTPTMHLVRRTAENSGPMLVLQRQEHLRAQCTEWAPVAFIALVRGEQLILTRDRVLDDEAMQKVLIEFARPLPAAAVEEGEEGVDSAVTNISPPNMPEALFRQQMDGVRAMLAALTAEEPVAPIEELPIEEPVAPVEEPVEEPVAPVEEPVEEPAAPAEEPSEPATPVEESDITSESAEAN
jgi:hypothetical protein